MSKVSRHWAALVTVILHHFGHLTYLPIVRHHRHSFISPHVGHSNVARCVSSPRIPVVVKNVSAAANNFLESLFEFLEKTNTKKRMRPYMQWTCVSSQGKAPHHDFNVLASFYGTGRVLWFSLHPGTHPNQQCSKSSWQGLGRSSFMSRHWSLRLKKELFEDQTKN